MADKQKDQRLPGFWREDRHLSFFLAFLVLMTIFVPMVGESRPGRIAIDLTFALMLLSGAVSVHRVMGGVAAYLLIGVTWAFGYKLLLEIIPNAIHFQIPLTTVVATGEPGRLIYFSFETLTTVSYGDAYPVHRIARSLTTAEALIGQLYPAILIATLVGMALQTRFNATLNDAEANKPS